jgi:hypothetical protein
MKKEKGSMLIIALITILILSFIVASAIRTTTEELYTTYNMYLQKSSYYTAIKGIEEAAILIKNSNDPASIKIDNNFNANDGTKRRYYTGDLSDNTGTAKNISLFQGFPPPPIPGISLGTSTGIIPLLWNVNIVSELKIYNRKAYSEINTGVYSIMLGY